MLAEVSSAVNYSLWPRRPDELMQARMLMAENRGSEAVYLLRPFWRARGVAGQEARQLTTQVNVPRYLSRSHPKATLYTVKRGDTLPRVARNSACPLDMVMMLNGIVTPSGLRIGQKLVVVPMLQHMELHLPTKEVSVWDEETLVASYRLERVDGVPMRGGNESTEVKARDAYRGGSRVHVGVAGVASSSDRVLVLANGMVLAGSTEVRGRAIYMNQKDLNELTLLVGEKAPVLIVRDEDKFYSEIAAQQGQGQADKDGSAQGEARQGESATNAVRQEETTHGGAGKKGEKADGFQQAPASSEVAPASQSPASPSASALTPEFGSAAPDSPAVGE